MHYLFKHTDISTATGTVAPQTDVVWQYESEDEAQDAADQYNANLAALGIPSWVCCYYVAS